MSAKHTIATRAHTRLAAAWLWHVRNCRFISLEVGVTTNGTVTRPLDGPLVRADVAGVARKYKPNKGAQTQPHFHRAAYRIDIVEVKGHRADWKREIKSGKLSQKWSYPKPDSNGLWLLVSNEITDEDVLPYLPEVWGLLRASADVDDVAVVREPYMAAEWRTHDDIGLTHEFFSLGACQSLPLPNMGRNIKELMAGTWKMTESST